MDEAIRGFPNKQDIAVRLTRLTKEIPGSVRCRHQSPLLIFSRCISKMSTKLVRKLLQETAPAEVAALTATSASTSAALEQDNKQQKKKRKRQDDSKPVEEQDVVNLRIQALLALDRKPTSKQNTRKGRASSRLLERKEKEDQTESKRRRKLASTIVGNSRSSSGQARTQRHEPTSNKKAHAKEQEEKSLRSIAKLLKQGSKKQKK